MILILIILEPGLYQQELLDFGLTENQSTTVLERSLHMAIFKGLNGSGGLV
jgi:hypothetical protein